MRRAPDPGFPTPIVVAGDAFFGVAAAYLQDNFCGTELMDSIFVEPAGLSRCWVDEDSIPNSVLELRRGAIHVRGYRLNCATVFVRTGGARDEVYLGPPGMSLSQYVS